jgi:hypothetical protein
LATTVTSPPSFVLVVALVALAESPGDPAGPGATGLVPEHAEIRRTTGKTRTANVRTFMA